MNETLHAAGGDCALICKSHQQHSLDSLASSLEFHAFGPKQSKLSWGIFPKMDGKRLWPHQCQNPATCVHLGMDVNCQCLKVHSQRRFT